MLANWNPIKTLLLQLVLSFAKTAARKEVLNIVGSLPKSGQYAKAGMGIAAATTLAISDVNEKFSILDRYRLEMAWIDSRCDMGYATRELFQLVQKRTATTFVFGDVCKDVTRSLAVAVPYFNLWQVSYADRDPGLSDRTVYKHFMRTVPSDTDFNEAIVRFILHYNWTRVATLFQDASTGDSTYAYTHNKLVSSLTDAGVNVVTTQSLTEDAEIGLKEIKSKDGRVIIGYFDRLRAKRVVCQAHRAGMYGAKYVWFLPTQYDGVGNEEAWWRSEQYKSQRIQLEPITLEKPDCFDSEVEKVLESHFTFDMMVIDDAQTTPTINGRLVDDYKERYELESGNRTSKFHGYAYDGVWLMAIALNKSLDKNGYLDYKKLQNSSVFEDIWTRTSFNGVTGLVKFQDRNRLAQLEVKQLIGGNFKRIAHYDMVTEDLVMSDVNEVYWAGSGPPRDKITIERTIQKPNMMIQVTLVALASFGLVLGLMFLAINIKFRKTRYIKMSSPNMNNLIIAGCIFTYISVCILRMDATSITRNLYAHICTCRAWLLAIGFSLAFGAMFAKTWRVFNIFNAPHKQKKAIKDHVLILLVVALVAIDFILLITWTVIDPLKVKEIELEAIEDEQKSVIPILVVCKSDRTNLWLPLFYGYKGLLLIAGCWFAWNTRQVSIPALNDSKYIGMSVYNVVIMCASAVAISYIINDKTDYGYLIIGLLVIICTTLTLCLVFLPKVLYLRKTNGNEECRRPRVILKQSSSRSQQSVMSHRDLKLTGLAKNLAEEIRKNEIKLLQLIEKMGKMQETIENGEVSTMKGAMAPTLYAGNSPSFATGSAIETTPSTAECKLSGISKEIVKQQLSNGIEVIHDKDITYTIILTACSEESLVTNMEDKTCSG